MLGIGALSHQGRGMFPRERNYMFSGGLYLENLPQRREDTTVDRACALNPRGMSGAQCKAMTRIAVRNHRFCCGNKDNAPCASKDRVCRACVTHSGDKFTVVDTQTGLCAFHTEHGSEKPQPWTGYQKTIPSVMIAVTQRPPAPERSPDMPDLPQVSSGGAKHHTSRVAQHKSS